MEPELIKQRDVAKLLGVALNTMKRIAESDESFPRQIRLSPGRVAYRRADILAWIEAR